MAQSSALLSLATIVNWREDGLRSAARRRSSATSRKQSSESQIVARKPIAMHGYVIFDNNAYKRIGLARLERIRAAEQGSGVVALANVAVIQEMLARVRHTNPERRGMNRAALKKLVRHCSTVTAEQIELHFVTHLDGQVYRKVTGESAPGDHEMFASFRELCRVVAGAERDSPLGEIADQLDEIERHVESKEREYVSSIETAAKAVVESNQMKRNLEYANRLVIRALSLYGRTISPERLITAIIPVAQVSSITFALRDGVIEEVRSKSGGQWRHRNTVWDEKIVASTSLYSTIRGKAIVLVTTEARLVEAAVRAGAGDRVVDVDGYEDVLGLDPWIGQHDKGASGRT